MRIVRVLIERHLEFEESLARVLKREFSYGCHIANYMLALTFLDLYDSNLAKKSRIWNKFVLTKSLQTKERLYRKLLAFKKDEDDIIFQAINKIDELKENDSAEYGSLYVPGTFGVLSYEFEANE